MNPSRNFLVFMLLADFTMAVAQAPVEKEKPAVLFAMAGKSVTTREFAYLFRKNHLKKEDFSEQKVTEYINLLVTFKAKVAEAVARGYDTTRTFRKEYSTYKAELKKPYVADKDQLTRLTRQAYDRMSLEVRASHILVGVPSNPSPADTVAAFTKIMSLRDRALKGEDFSTLARTYSEDPTARTNGGDLGYFTAMQMVYPFEEAAYNLKTGEISMPVRTRFGYHVIRLTDRRLARGEVEVSHITLRSDDREDKRVRTKIFQIHAELLGGRPWDEACKEYTDDATTRNSGGRLRPFGVGVLSGVPEFEQAAFALHDPGEISDPFQSGYGWHIVRLERRIPIPPFEQVEESLRKRISRDDRLRFADERVRKQQLKRFEFAEYTDAKKQVLDLADSTLDKARWRYRGSPALRGMTLFTLKGKPYTVDEFIRYAEQEQTPHTMAPRDYLSQLLTAFIHEKADACEEEELIRDHPEYANLINEYREGILLFTIMEKEVWNKATEDTVGLRTWYESNKTRYAGGERVRARIFSSDDSVFVHAALKKIQHGDSLSRNEVKRFKSIQGPRNFAPGESKAVDRASKIIGVHKVKVESAYYLVQVESLVPAGIRSLEEIRSQVISDYQDYLEKEWVKSLKAKYPVKVNSKARKSVIRVLTQP